MPLESFLCKVVDSIDIYLKGIDMNIIFASNQIDQIAEKYTVLELDTVHVVAKGLEQTAYCVIEKIPMTDIFQLESLKQQHHNMMTQYKNRSWHSCQQQISALVGAWGGEIDGFYHVMLARVNEHMVNEPKPDWTPVIQKH